MKKVLIYVLVTLGLNSCKKNHEASSPPPKDSFSFGSAYGFCGKNCTSFFLIENGQLFPNDSNDRYYNNLHFKTIPLPKEDYALAKPLLDSLPLYFRTHSDTVFGCPDCYDQGTIQLQLKEKGVTKKWLIDPNTSAIPVEIREYTKRVMEVISALRN